MVRGRPVAPHAMHWSLARKTLLPLASGHRAGPAVDITRAGIAAPGPRAASLCVASGKGGTGKSIVSASLAHLLSARGRTLLVDADFGVGNAHILQDVTPSASFVEVVEGTLSVRDARIPCADGLDLLAAGSGVPRMAELSSYELMLIASGLAELEREYRFLVVDSAAGLSRQTVSFARAADVIVIVTTPDLTAMTDAYALYKVLCTAEEELRTFLLVNRASGAGEAEEVWLRIARVCERFMGSAPERLGWIPEDRTVAACVNRRGPVARLEPRAPAAGALRRIAVRLLHELCVGGEGLGVRLAR